MIHRQLTYRQGFFGDAKASAALDALLQHVFAFAPLRTQRAAPIWMPFAYFAEDDVCVASVEAARLELLLDGRPACATAIRLAGVAETHRGQGLFKALMTRALAWCDSACDGPTLLYTEDDALYARFGFAPLTQHAFLGAAPLPAPATAAVPLDRAEAARGFDRLAPRRAPVSDACAIVGADGLFREVLRGDADLAFAWSAEFEALLVYEEDDDTLVLADVVAVAMPPMARIVGALGSRWRRVRTLFPPDRLDWAATPEPDATGLMIRGAVPDAMRRPFMLPPTTGF